MEYRQLGDSSLKLSAITFGAWAIGGWMWGGSDRKEAVNAIRDSFAEGVTTIDTAPAYGQGLSEEIIAEAMESVPRDKYQVLTKCGLRWDLEEGEFFFNSRDNENRPIDVYKNGRKHSIIKECEDCLKRLKTDYIDLFQLHWPDNSTPISETMEAFQLLKQQGKILEAGVCNYSKAQMEEADLTFKFVSNQVPYSMVLRDIEQEVIPYALKFNKGVIAYSPLQRGLLTGKIKPGHKFSEGDTREGNRFYTDINIKKINAFLDELRPMAEVKDCSLSQLVIRWTLQRPGITIALVGARNSEQAIQNSRAMNVKLSSEDVIYIDSKLEALTLGM
ncbi:MAG: aldo/keto reductase [Flavitalea sp.]